MKRYFLVTAFIVLLAISLMGCSTDSKETISIEGTWQAYGAMYDGEIHPFDDNYVNEEASEQVMGQTLTFNGDGTLVLNNGLTDLSGTYEPLDDGYLAKVPFGSAGETAEFTCVLQESDLVVTLVVPEGFEDDAGYSTVYRKAD